MWLRKCGQMVRLSRILCPEGTIGLSLGFQPQDTLTIRDPPRRGGRNWSRIWLGIKGGKLFSTHFQGGRLLHPYPGLNPGLSPPVPSGQRPMFGHLSAKSTSPTPFEDEDDDEDEND
jgi:hypothetical protein